LLKFFKYNNNLHHQWHSQCNLTVDFVNMVGRVFDEVDADELETA